MIVFIQGFILGSLFKNPPFLKSGVCRQVGEKIYQGTQKGDFCLPQVKDELVRK